MTNYEKEYQRCERACGPPFAEIVDFFDRMAPSQSVLDLGCGQGRDALEAARRGHRVHGVDLSPSGVAQLAEHATREEIDLTCEIADIETFEPEQRYDVIVLDRVLHMLPTDDRRRALLARVRRWLHPSGHVLIADTRRNRSLIRDAFPPERWTRHLDQKDFLFVQRRDEP